MLASSGPLGVLQGRMRANEPAATDVLHSAIKRTANPTNSLGTAGIGVPLWADDGSPAIAHVLPLGGAHRNGGPHATAAVFVTPSEQALPPADALAALYDLTPTEARVALAITTGRNRSEAAADLGMTDNTAKSHLVRVFSKTGTHDQTALARLVNSLGAPVRKVR